MKPISFLVLMGASGAGKTTIARALLDALPGRLVPVTSVTTNAPRPDWMPGEYRAVNDQTFAELEQTGEFAWTASHRGKRFGTLRNDVERIRRTPDTIGLLILVPERVHTLKTICPGEVFAVFIYATEQERRKRLLRSRTHRSDIERGLRESSAFHALAQELGVVDMVLENNDADDITNAVERIRLMFAPPPT